MAKILVTGDSGLIGYHLAKILAKKHEVYGMSKTLRNLDPSVSRYTLDLRNKKETKKIISTIQPEIIYHCAANAAENLSTFSPIDSTTNNYDTFWNVLVPAINTGKLRRFVFTSSIAVYGAIHIPFREQDLPLPQDIYGVTKLAIEQSLRIMADIHGFEYVVVRPHNVFGEGQRMDDKYRNVIALFMNQLLKGEPYTIYGDGSMKRCYSYVKDVVDIICKCGFEDVAGMTFNVGSDRAYTLSKLSQLIEKVSGIKIKPNYLPTRVHETHTAVSDHTLCKKVFGYHESSMYQALENMWEYAKAIGPQEYKFDKPEIDSSVLPSNWK